MFRTQEQLSLSANKAHKFVCTVFRTVEFYARTILLTGGIDSFKFRNQEGNKSFMARSVHMHYDYGSSC